jgi:uncharacterized YigZ family protein
MATDSFLTIKSSSEGIFKEKGSRFLAFAFPVENEDEIGDILENLRKQYHDARHHCYAWRLGPDSSHFRTNDDGEPGNSAGKPILGQIQSFQLTNVLVVVVRYFGGTLLGVGGLIQAYKTASLEALKNAFVIERYIYAFFRISFRYEDMNVVMKVIKDLDLEQWDQHFELECELKVKIRKSEEENLKGAFRKDSNVKMETISDVGKVLRQI